MPTEDYEDMSIKAEVLRIDNKHSVYTEGGEVFLAKRTPANEFIRIPSDEPIILFRARDKHSVPMLRYYIDLCVKDGCTDYQRENMEQMLKRFEDFGGAKQPGCTNGY